MFVIATNNTVVVGEKCASNFLILIQNTQTLSLFTLVEFVKFGQICRWDGWNCSPPSVLLRNVGGVGGKRQWSVDSGQQSAQNSKILKTVFKTQWSAQNLKIQKLFKTDIQPNYASSGVLVCVFAIVIAGGLTFVNRLFHQLSENIWFVSWKWSVEVIWIFLAGRDIKGILRGPQGPKIQKRKIRCNSS